MQKRNVRVVFFVSTVDAQSLELVENVCVCISTGNRAGR